MRAQHPRCRPFLTLAIAAAALLGLAGTAQAAPVTIDFESGAAVNEAVTNQYGPPGTVAGPEFKKGTEVSTEKFQGLNCGPPHLSESGVAHSGSKSILLDGCAGGEFYPSATFFHLGYSTHLIEFWLAAGTGVEVWTTAFDATGSIVGQQQTILTGTGYQHVEVQTFGDQIANVAIEMGSTNPPNPESASGVNLAYGNTHLRVDDLTYDPPSSPPESSFLIGANPAATAVTPGKQVTVKIPITWSNNPNPSASPVSLEFSGPAGLTGAFSPQTTTSGTSDLTITAAKSTSPGVKTVKIEGYVDKGLPAEKHAEGSVKVEVLVPFIVSNPGDITIAPCTPKQVVVQVPAASNFSDPLTIDVRSFQSSAAISAISPGEVLAANHATATVFQQNGIASATVTLSASAGTTPAGPKSLLVTASSSGYADQTATGTVAVEAAHVSKLLAAGTSITPTSVSTPELGIPGSKLTLEGTGFCPSTKVGIGDPNGAATPESISSDGKSLTFRVPRSAVTGNVKVIPPTGEAFEGPKVPVRSFRNTFGFSWKNGDYGLRLNGEMVDELFGKDETNINVFGWLIRKPEATLFESTANNFIPKGICFGMAFSGEELREFPLEISTFPRTGGNSVWNLDAADKPSPALLRYVTERFSLQFTDQVIPIITGQLLGQAVNAHPSNEDLSMIEAELAKGRPVMIGLLSFSPFGGHTVLAYDTEPLGEGKTAVYIANSNNPYTTGEESNPAAHDTEEFTNSKITIDSGGHWSLAELNWDGPDSNLFVFRHDDLPILNGKRPKLPNVFTAATLAIGSAFISLGSSGDSVTQVSDGHGGELTHGGQITSPTSWPNGVAPIPNFSGAPGPPQLIAADAHRTSPFTATVRRGAKGGAMSMNLPGLQASIDANTDRGQVDKVGVDPSGRFISYRSGAGSTPYIGTLLAAPGGGAHSSAGSRELSEHLVRVHATAGGSGSERFSFQGGRVFALHHNGPPGKVSLTLSAFRSNGQPVGVRLPKMRLSHGEDISIAPLRWSSLDSKPIRIQAKIGGHRTSRLVRGKHIGRRFATVRGATLHAGKGGGLDLRLRLRHRPAGAWISPSVHVLRAGHPVARTIPAQLLDRSLSAGKAHLKLSRSVSGGHYTLRVRLLEVTADGPIQGSTVVQTTIKVVAKGG